MAGRSQYPKRSKSVTRAAFDHLRTGKAFPFEESGPAKADLGRRRVSVTQAVWDKIRGEESFPEDLEIVKKSKAKKKSAARKKEHERLKGN